MTTYNGTIASGNFNYDPSTDAGRVRLLCTDTNSTYPIFDDDEISAFLSLNGSSVKRAAAGALRTIAASEVLVQKRIKLMDLQTDGPAEAAELRRLAKDLISEAEVDEAGDGDASDYAEMADTVFQKRERIWKQGLRSL